VRDGYSWRVFARCFFVLSELFGFPYATGGAGMDFDLNAYQWKNRIILIFAPSSDSDGYKRQMREFGGQEDGILDRDLIILELFKNGEFSIFLIGKDGTVKLRSNDPVATSEIFSLIDAMPMRQEEMHRKQNSMR
jgi:hypothetical protein